MYQKSRVRTPYGTLEKWSSATMRRTFSKCRLRTPPTATLTSAAIAQLGERQTEDLEVPGSIPGFGTRPQSPPYLCAKPGTTPSCNCRSQARLAQLVERKALNLVVVGSSPTVGVLWGTIPQLPCPSSSLQRSLCLARACGVVVSRLLCMQKASGSNPDKSNLVQ